MDDYNYDKSSVIQKLAEAEKVLPVITEFWKGGDRYDKGASDFSNKLRFHLCIPPKRTFEPSPTNITKNFGHLQIDLLCGTVNGKSNSKSLDQSIYNAKKYNTVNSTSAVTLWRIAGNKYLFPGDATVHTMMHLNNLNNIDSHTDAIMTAPHHGSDHSSKGSKIVADKEEYRKMPDQYKGDWGIYREFLDNYKPSAVTISAGKNYGFGHPGPEFVKATDCYFNNTGTDEHIIYTCIHEDSKNKYYGLYQTSSPIYSTLQYDTTEGNKGVYFQCLQFNNSVTPAYGIVKNSKIACQCNPGLSNYLTLNTGSCAECSPKFVSESDSSSDWFCKYKCESTVAKDENNEDQGSSSATSGVICSRKRAFFEVADTVVEVYGENFQPKRR